MKKLYVLKNGEDAGIYLEWLDFFERIDGRDDVKYKIISYREDLADEDRNVPFSMKWAFQMAKEYLESKEESPDKVSQSSDGFSIQESEEIPFDDFDRILEESEKEYQEELHKKLWIEKELRMGSAWLDLLLMLAGTDNPRVSRGKFTGRYFAPSLYILILYLILDTDKVLDEVFERHELLSQKKLTVLEKENWYDCIRYELGQSAEYKELKQKFETYQFNKLELNELCHRNRQYIEGTKLLNKEEAYKKMQEFVSGANHTIVQLYEEIVGNPIYKKALEMITCTFKNPDLKKELSRQEVFEKEKEEENKTLYLEQIVRRTGKIRNALKQVVIGQEEAIHKLEHAFFHNEKVQKSKKGTPKSVYLFAGPPGVGKTYMAEHFAKELGMSYRRFDMTTYGSHGSMDEIVGISSFYNNSKPGVLTTYVNENPKSVLLFDEIEKADISVLRLFLQILDEGICFDRYYDRNVSFQDCIIIMTTNAGKQLYENAGNENLTELSDRVIMDGLIKDVDMQNNRPIFPPEIVSRMASHTIIMFNHLKADAIRLVIKNDVEKILEETKKSYGFDISKGSDILAATVQYSVGGSGDARNASRLAGKLIDREIYELFLLLGEKYGNERNKKLKQVSWECDFTDCSDEIRQFYLGEPNCVVPILKDTDKEYHIAISPMLTVKVVRDMDVFMEIIRNENVLFAVIDYVYGRKEAEISMNIADAKTIGQKAFRILKEENMDIPIYLSKNDTIYLYSESEKNTLLKMGVEGFVDEGDLAEQIQKVYRDVCCKNVMELLSLRHQVLTYATRKEINEAGTCAKIIFYNLKLELAVDAEDKESLISDELRPDKKWDDIYISKDVRNELEFFVKYLTNIKEYVKTGVRIPRGALMYGPPGTGKTSLAKVVASESKINFLSVGADELKNGGVEKVHHIFQVARKYAPAVLFIDEIDAIGVTRTQTGANAVLNALLTEMDGFKRINTKPVFVMAATNLKGIDRALERRFDRSFMVGLPNEEGRKWILEKLLKRHVEKFRISEKEIESIVVRSRGLSPADLENMIETALREGIRNGTVIEDAMLDEIFERCNFGERKEENSEKEIKRIAYHEVGHALIELYYGREPEHMSIIARGNYGGYVQGAQLKENPTKERLLQRICMCLGGRAAELEFGYGITVGAGADLADATQIATWMVCEYGMYEDEIGLAVITKEEFKTDRDAKILVNRILKEQLEQARAIINEKREDAERLVLALLRSEKKYLTKKDIMEVYKNEK